MEQKSNTDSADRLASAYADAVATDADRWRTLLETLNFDLTRGLELRSAGELVRLAGHQRKRPAYDATRSVKDVFGLLEANSRGLWSAWGNMGKAGSASTAPTPSPMTQAGLLP
jgi:hypothetical protein